MTKIDILIQLREAFNEEQTQADKDSLSFYAANSEKTHSILPFTYGNLIELAKGFAEEKISEEDFKNIEKISEFELFFDLNKLTLWLNRIHDEENFKLQQYSAQVIDHDLLPQELMDAIPLENRFSMEFSKFKVDSIAQKELLFLSQEFCHFILNQRPKLVIVSGKAGIGKTASAICAAKELSLLGKNVIFISEVMVKRWADQAKSFADLKNCAIEINKLLDKNPDVVILDDNNLVDYSGHLLLEKLYNWYVTNKNKGLFITSNEPVNFKECYGYQLDNSYLYPPFNHYNSPQYLHFKIRKDLTGESLRNQYEGQSIGAIVCESYWKENEDKLGEFELIPALDDSLELAPIRCSLAEYKSYKCETYNKLRPIQRQWLHITENNVNVKKFDSTFYKTIVIELTEKSYINKKNINITSFENLMRVLNFAHNNGGRRVILINSTSFNHEGLINQIKIQLPLAEQERMYSRLKLLLCESEKSIFEYDQFKGYIDIPTSCKASEGEIVLKPKPLYSRKRGRINQVVTLDWNLENNIKLLFSPNHLGSPKDEIQQPIEGLIEYKNLKQ